MTEASAAPSAGTRAFLRHVLATLAYRGGKALRDAPASFATFQAGPATRTPGEILAHVGDLLDWALSMARGEARWSAAAPRTWEQDAARFHAGLGALDAFLAGDAAIACPAERLFQGPLADALTHVGQLAMLRGMAGAPTLGENYFVADIATGRTGADQAPPVRVFA